MESKINSNVNGEITVLKKKRVRKVSTKPKRKKKGVFAMFENFFHDLADAGNVDEYEKIYVPMYSKKKKN